MVNPPEIPQSLSADPENLLHVNGVHPTLPRAEGNAPVVYLKLLLRIDHGDQYIG